MQSGLARGGQLITTAGRRSGRLDVCINSSHFTLLAQKSWLWRKLGFIFNGASIGQVFSPQPNSLKAESNFPFRERKRSGVRFEKELHGHAVVMISAPRKKLALQSHLLFGEPLTRPSDGMASPGTTPVLISLYVAC